MIRQKGNTILGLLIIIIAILGFIGWIMNIVDIIHSSFNPVSTLLILRFVGIVIAPIGAFLGWFF